MEQNEHKKPYVRISGDQFGPLYYFSKDGSPFDCILDELLKESRDSDCDVDDLVDKTCGIHCHADELILDGYEDTPFVVPGFNDWFCEWNDFYLGYLMGDKRHKNFDWEYWDERGLDVAQKLRQVLPEEIDVFYAWGKKEILIKKIHRFQIKPDYLFTIGYQGDSSIMCLDDEISIGMFLTFKIPGIFDWWVKFHLYGNHLEIDVVPDPDFDWASWYAKGLEFAKEIRAKLDPSVELWYCCPTLLRNVFPVRDLKVQLDGSFKVGEYLKES